jgi:phosphoadenosine phosphosulfate reductase
LWSADQDACCNLRKVVPLAAALAPFDAWITGRKRYQGGERSTLPVVESDGGRLKFNPLAKVTQEQIAAVFAGSGLPEHPLAALGYRSVGCLPCTSRVQAGEDPRAGRWRGSAKTECGIHSVVKY